MLNRMFAVLAAGVGAASLIGCVDPRGAFDDFNGRVGTTDASTIDGPEGAIHDITGTFLLGVRVGAFGTDPSLYIQFLVTWDLTPNGTTATLDGSYMPLCVYSACAERTMRPPPINHNGAVVAADGSFEQPVDGFVDGMANPISGSPIDPLDGLITGTIVSPDLVCGTVSGTAHPFGVDLAGSTFAAIRVTDTTPANLPAPLIQCPGAMPVDGGT